MSTITHPVFGTIDPSAPGDWTGSTSFGGREVDVELMMEDALDTDTLRGLLQYLDDLTILDAKARDAMRDNVAAGRDAAVPMYVSLHLERLPDDQLEAIFATSDRAAIDAESFLERLSLVAVAVHPHADDEVIVLSYSVRPEVTNTLVAVSFEADGEVAAVDLES